MKTPLLAGTTVLAAIAWTLALIAESEPWTGVGALLIGTSILATATVATVGMVVSHGRWSHRLGLGSLGLTLIVASVRPIDPLWWVGLIATALAIGALLSPQLMESIRQLPAASGPPPSAIAPAIALLFVPSVVGFVSNDAPVWASLLLGISALVFGFLYSRVVWGGLFAVRVIWPAMALATAPFMGWTAGIVTALAGLGVGALSWNPAVKASFHPPVESGTSFPIPPELAPTEILDAAGIDDQGNPK